MSKREHITFNADTGEKQITGEATIEIYGYSVDVGHEDRDWHVLYYKITEVLHIDTDELLPNEVSDAEWEMCLKEINTEVFELVA